MAKLVILCGNHCKRMLERTIISFKCHLIWNQPLLNTLHICCPGQNNLYASSFSLKTSIYSRCILYKLNHSYIQGKHTSGTQIWVWSSLGKKLWNNKNSVSKYIRGLPTKNILDVSYEFFWVFFKCRGNLWERKSIVHSLGFVVVLGLSLLNSVFL